MPKKIIDNKKSDLLSKEAQKDDAAHDVEEKNDADALDRKGEREQLFQELKKQRDSGMTEEDLRSVLASLKYNTKDHFTEEEIDALAQELGVGEIEKKINPSPKTLPHASRMDRAHHVANYAQKHSRGSGGVQRRSMPNDDITHLEANGFSEGGSITKSKESVVSGDMVYEKEEKTLSLVDVNSGKHFLGKATQLKRPDMKLKSKTSLRGRGLVAGGKKM